MFKSRSINADFQFPTVLLALVNTRKVYIYERLGTFLYSENHQVNKEQLKKLLQLKEILT